LRQTLERGIIIAKFAVPKNLIAFIENNDKKMVEEVLSAFSNFWEVDRNTLNELIEGEKDLHGTIYSENFRQ
jgi:hypothetical protein